MQAGGSEVARARRSTTPSRHDVVRGRGDEGAARQAELAEPIVAIDDGLLRSLPSGAEAAGLAGEPAMVARRCPGVSGAARPSLAFPAAGGDAGTQRGPGHQRTARAAAGSAPDLRPCIVRPGE